MLRFGEFVNHFTILARQILSSDGLSNAKIDEFTDQLSGLLDTMPEMLQFDESWLNSEKELPEWPLSAMSAGMLLLEDRGLQSYTSERFVPFTCPERKAVSEATNPTKLKQEQDSQFHGFSNPLADEKPNRSNKTVNELQDGAESPLSYKAV
ncbi:hypothetical protein E8E12_008487 [Didymella heteroderae]|uniref:Uncharacterized protein n=1 Tax=Didymella heteroderae TaxID=1769908 RepID=A0A9P4WS60_9PLEO|nr:hypothetical protein E8E12_008487 [Didymella heteroderae]